MWVDPLLQIVRGKLCPMLIRFIAFIGSICDMAVVDGEHLLGSMAGQIDLIVTR